MGMPLKGRFTNFQNIPGRNGREKILILKFEGRGNGVSEGSRTLDLQGHNLTP